jgi:hypothetical protein
MARRRVVFAGQAEGARHRVGGDVVMGGADAAAGEDIVGARAQRVDRLDDRVLVIGTMRTSRRSMPMAVRMSARCPILRSLVRPDRISSPMATMEAVTISFMW